jgi:hypothetical protein
MICFKNVWAAGVWYEAQGREKGKRYEVCEKGACGPRRAQGAGRRAGIYDAALNHFPVNIYIFTISPTLYEPQRSHI